MQSIGRRKAELENSNGAMSPAVGEAAVRGSSDSDWDDESDWDDNSDNGDDAGGKTDGTLLVELTQLLERAQQAQQLA